MTAQPCPKCGAQVDPTAQFCAQCGAQIVAGTSAAIAPTGEATTSPVRKVGVAAGRAFRSYDAGLKRRWPRGRWVVHGVTGLLLLGFIAAPFSNAQEPGTAAAPSHSPSSVAAASSPTPTPSQEPTPTPEPTATIAEPEPTPTPTPEPTPTLKPTPKPTPKATPKPASIDYKRLSDRSWARLVKNPDSKTGNAYEIWACIYQFDAATGTDAFLAHASNEKQEYWYLDGENSAFVGTESKLADFVEGDAVQMKVISLGSYSYDTQAGGNTTVPKFEVRKITHKGSCD